MPKGKKGFVKNDPNINREGLNKGSGKEKSFVEYFDEVAEEIAMTNKMSVDDVRKVIYKVGYAKAKEGNYQFYKDILDRIHGQATSKQELTGTINVIPIYGGLSNNNAIPKYDSDTKNFPASEENKGSIGRDFSEQDNINPSVVDRLLPDGSEPDLHSGSGVGTTPEARSN